MIRLMMDMPAQFVTASVNLGSNSGINAHVPINRQNAINMITQMEESTIQSFAIKSSDPTITATVPRVAATPEMRASMEAFLPNITQLYTEDKDIAYDISDVLWEYKNSGGTDYSECYDAVLKILQENQSGKN